MDTIQKNSVKVIFRVALTEPDGDVVDLTDLATCTYIFRSPTSVRTTWSAVVDGDPLLGKVKYVSQAGELGETGRWEIQVLLVFDDGSTFYSRIGKFKVKDNL